MNEPALQLPNDPSPHSAPLPPLTVAPAAPPKLSVRNLSVSFLQKTTGKATVAVDDVSLEFREGEFVAIVGLSGCGKSTLLNAVAGLVKPRSGTIEVAGRRVSGPGPDRALVFQKPSLLPWRTVWRNVTYGLELRNVPHAEATTRARRFVDLVRLTGFEDFHPRQLSGGMQQRVNLARALVCDPEVLLLDEPFGALDAITREMMQRELLSIWEQTRKTVLMVTHQIDEALFLADRVVVLSARPARVVEDIEVSLPRPRDLHVKNTHAFRALADRIWTHIETEFGVEGAEEAA
jgi:NitT/TauT family transport system ATP-binding protein